MRSHPSTSGFYARDDVTTSSRAALQRDPQEKGYRKFYHTPGSLFCVLPCRELRTYERAPILPAEIARWNDGESNETVHRRGTERKSDELAAKRTGFDSRSIFLTVPLIQWVCGTAVFHTQSRAITKPLRVGSHYGKPIDRRRR